MNDTPPLDPTSPEARQWVLDELGTGRYSTEPPWWQRFLEWLNQFFDFAPGGRAPTTLLVVALLVVVALIVLVVLRRVRPESRVGRRTPRGGAVDDEGLDAAAYRDRAQRALARGDWDTALLDAYRAIAASAVERTLLVDLPGRTAHEVAVGIAPAFPDHGAAITSAANDFDDVRYGHRPASNEQAKAVVDLDTALRHARPVLTDDSTSPQVVAR
ncbi:DUF4129 domain-containing protein [Knoellia koreensis]|uniref:DUF4129 domain-containing protein n=1 Tax=Knoellia koreensis TaxID=2730921 RepID=A0A849HEV3_9MICO|nr:DUF4129 domain-containing protein [Knoellia sp. DB2414S]